MTFVITLFHISYAVKNNHKAYIFCKLKYNITQSNVAGTSY